MLCAEKYLRTQIFWMFCISIFRMILCWGNYSFFWLILMCTANISYAYAKWCSWEDVLSLNAMCTTEVHRCTARVNRTHWGINENSKNFFQRLWCGFFSPPKSGGLHMCGSSSKQSCLIFLGFTLDISRLTAHCLQLHNSMGSSGFRALSWRVDPINLIKKSPGGQCGTNSYNLIFSLCFIISRWPDAALPVRLIQRWHNSEVVWFLWTDDKVGLMPMSDWHHRFKDGHKRHKPRVIYWSVISLIRSICMWPHYALAPSQL